jgi:hypothetical protein
MRKERIDGEVKSLISDEGIPPKLQINYSTTHNGVGAGKAMLLEQVCCSW